MAWGTAESGDNQKKSLHHALTGGLSDKSRIMKCALRPNHSLISPTISIQMLLYFHLLIGSKKNFKSEQQTEIYLLFGKQGKYTHTGYIDNNCTKIHNIDIRVNLKDFVVC